METVGKNSTSRCDLALYRGLFLARRRSLGGKGPGSEECTVDDETSPVGTMAARKKHVRYRYGAEIFLSGRWNKGDSGNESSKS